MELEAIDAKDHTKVDFHPNVRHISVVGNWLYLMYESGGWAKLDAQQVTLEIDNTEPLQAEVPTSALAHEIEPTMMDAFGRFATVCAQTGVQASFNSFGAGWLAALELGKPVRQQLNW